MTEKDLYDLIDVYKRYGVNPNVILEQGTTWGDDFRPIRECIADLKNWNPTVASNLAKRLERVIRLDGDRALNTYPDLIKNNLDVFFPDGVPEDALDDYEVDKHNIYDYVTIDELQDPDSGYSPEEFTAYREALAKEILDEHRKSNEFNKSPEGKKLSSEIIEMLNGDLF